MAITCWINANGSISSGDYVLGSDEFVANETFVGDLAISSPGGSWGSLNVIDATGAWFHGGTNDNGEGLVESDQGRILVLWDEGTFQQDNHTIFLCDVSGNARLRLYFTSTTNTRVQYQFNNTDSECLFNFERTDGPQWLEIKYDHTQATAANRLQCRTWAIGDSVPASFSTASSTSGASGSTPSAFTDFSFGNAGDATRYRIGFFGASDDPDEDLSAYVADIEAGDDEYPTGGGGVSIPVFINHFKMQGIQ